MAMLNSRMDRLPLEWVRVFEGGTVRMVRQAAADCRRLWRNYL